MNVRELILKLREFDGDLMVVVDGYEGGVNELKQVLPEEIVLNVHEEYGYFGKHELVEWRDRGEKVEVVYLPRS